MGGINNTKSRMHQNALRKGILQIFGYIGIGHHQTNNERKSNKSASEERESYSKPNSAAEIS